MSQKHKPDSDWITGGGFRTLVLAAATVGGLYLCSLLVWPFLAPIAWALALAVLFAPLHRLLRKYLKRPNLAAAIAVLTIGIIVIMPVTFVGERLVGAKPEAVGPEPARPRDPGRRGRAGREVDAEPRRPDVVPRRRRIPDAEDCLRGRQQGEAHEDDAGDRTETPGHRAPHTSAARKGTRARAATRFPRGVQWLSFCL